MPEDLTIGNGLDELDFPGDPSKLPTSSELPLGTIEVKIVHGEPGLTAAATEQGKVGEKAIVNVQFVMTDHPGQSGWAGFPNTETFWLGSDQDPKARKWGTWARNGVLLMSMFKESGVHFGEGTKLREALKAAEEQVLLADVRLKGGKNKAWADRHVIRKFYKAGSRPVQLVEESRDAGGAGDAELQAAFSTVSNED